MTVNAALGYDTAWTINGTEVIEVIEVTPPNNTADRVESTHMKSPGRRREYIAGLLGDGTASFSINWMPGSATDIFLRALKDSGATATHVIEWSNGTTVTFDGALLTYEKSVPIDDRMTAAIEIDTSGDEVWA